MIDELKQHLQFILSQLLASKSYVDNTLYRASDSCMWTAIAHLSRLIPDFKSKNEEDQINLKTAQNYVKLYFSPIKSNYFELWDSVKYKGEDYFVIGRDWCTDGEHYWKYQIIKENDIQYVKHDELTSIE